MPALPSPQNNTSASSVATLKSGSSFSSYSSTSTSSSSSTALQPSDLMDQLKNSPETRFHAAWLFLRFFYLTMSPDRNSGPRNNARNISRQSSLNSNTSASTNQEGRDLIIWDIAIACLALSVKVIVFLALFRMLIKVMGLSSFSAIFCILYFLCTHVNILRWPLDVYLTRIWRYRPSRLSLSFSL